MQKCRWVVIVTFFTGLVLSCTPPAEDLHISRAFYHWKTVFDPQKTEKSYLEKLEVRKIYLHFFDVDTDPLTRTPASKAGLIFKTLPGQEIIPVVFITNKTLEAAGKKDVEVLAGNIFRKVSSVCDKYQLSYAELQLDCDWSKSTKEKYFSLLGHIRNVLPRDTKLSATIRLHQVKFPDITGIPPVDRGTLMIYNTGDWRKAETANSLFDLHTIVQYLGNLGDYPLPLDIALPVFEQTIVYRNSVFHNFIKDESPENLNASGFLKRPANPAIFVCAKDTIYRGMTFRKGDMLRHEKAALEDLLKIKNMITAKLANKDLSIILYHLNESSVKNYPADQLEKLFAEN